MSTQSTHHSTSVHTRSVEELNNCTP